MGYWSRAESRGEESRVEQRRGEWCGGDIVWMDKVSCVDVM